MQRLVILVLTLVAGLTAVAMARDRGPDRAGVTRTAVTPRARLSRPSLPETPSLDVELRRRATRWTCSVRHARTGSYYKCTEREEKKSCRCAIAKCKHWNPGQQQQCSSACRCKKK